MVVVVVSVLWSYGEGFRMVWVKSSGLKLTRFKLEVPECSPLENIRSREKQYGTLLGLGRRWRRGGVRKNAMPSQEGGKKNDDILWPPR